MILLWDLTKGKSNLSKSRISISSRDSGKHSNLLKLESQSEGWLEMLDDGGTDLIWHDFDQIAIG